MKIAQQELERAALAFATRYVQDLPPVLYSDTLRIRQRVQDNYRAHGPIQIVVIGDSVSQGCFKDPAPYDYHAVYHDRLRLMIGARHPRIPVNIINAAVGGVDARFGLEHFERDVVGHRPDLVIAAYGLNDINNPLEEYRANVRSILALCRFYHLDAVWMTENMLNTYRDEAGTDPQYLNYASKTAEIQNGGVMDAFVAAAREEAARAQVPVADAYAVWRAMQEAGLDTTRLLVNRINHPTRGMHQIFAEVLYHCIFGISADRAEIIAPPEDGMAEAARQA